MTTGPALHHEEVEDAVAGHYEWVTEQMPEWDAYLRAYKGEFWKGANPWSSLMDDSLPIKMESNRLFDYVQKFIANLLFRAPRAEVAPPGIEEDSPGRPRDHSAAAAKVAALGNEWLLRSGAQRESTHGLQQSLFYGSAGYKLTPNRFATLPLDKFIVSIIPRWDAIWDDRETNTEQQLYRGHIRYERIDWVEYMFPGTDVPESLRCALPGPNGEHSSVQESVNRTRPKRYCKVLEFYDLLARRGRYYLATEGRNPSLTLIAGSEGPLPYPLANGRPGIPIVPLLVANEPSRPLAGMSAMKRQYRLVAEMNLLLTILANALRRDATRLSFMPQELLTKEVVDKIKAAKDGDVIPVPTGNMDWVKLIHTMQLPAFSQHLDKYKGWLLDESQATSGISNLQQGKQGNYLSATEAEFLANSGETAATEVGARLTDAMSRLVEIAVAAHATQRKNLSVKMPDGKKQRLTPDEMRHPWVVNIEDAAATPMRLAKRQQGFIGVQKVLLDLSAVASAPDVQQQPAAAGMEAAAPPAPGVTEEMRRMARAQMNFIATQWELDSMSWDAIAMGLKEKKPQPTEPEPVDPELEAKVTALLSNAVAQGEQLPVPPTPPPLV
jgi:hypothetical protein